MPKFYAQLNAENKCVAVSQLRDTVDRPDMIEINSLDSGLIGRHWDGTVFGEPAEQPEFVTRKIFFKRFTAAERIAIRTAAETDTVIEDLLDMLDSGNEIELTSQDTINGLNYLVSQSLLDASRPAEILAY